MQPLLVTTEGHLTVGRLSLPEAVMAGPPGSRDLVRDEGGTFGGWGVDIVCIKVKS